MSRSLLVQVARRLAGLLHTAAAFLSEILFGWSMTWGPGKLRKRWLQSGLGHGCVLKERVLFIKRGGSAEAHSFKESAHATVYAGYVHADALLEDNVSFMAVTEERAIFCVAPPGVDVYDPDVAPFVYVAQYNQAVEWLSISLENFVALGHRVGDPQARVVQLSNTGRCGSTVLTRMLKRGGGDNLVCMSEPDFFDHLQELLFEGRFQRLQVSLDQLLLACFRLQCKPSSRRQEVSCYLIKTRGNCISLVPEVTRAVPFVTHVWMYRNPAKTIASFCTLSKALKEVNTVTKISLEEILDKLGLLPSVPAWPTERELFGPLIVADDAPTVAEAAWGQIEAIEALQRSGANDEVTFWSLFIGLHILAYDRCRAKGICMPTVGYEDLLTDPNTVLPPILALCGIPVTSLSECVAETANDSQGKTVMSQANMAKHRVDGFGDEHYRKINRVFSELGLPNVENYRRLYDK